MQDSAPCLLPKRWLIPNIRPYPPPQSLDLNLIELVWTITNSKMENDRPKDKKDLKLAIQRA